MPFQIELGGIPATVKDREWTCADASTLKLLNTLIDPRGPSASDPNPDRTLAHLAVSRWGATLISQDKPDPSTPEPDGLVTP